MAAFRLIQRRKRAFGQPYDRKRGTVMTLEQWLAEKGQVLPDLLNG